MAALKLPNWEKMIFLKFSFDNYIKFLSLKWLIWRTWQKQQTPRIFLPAWSAWVHIVFFFVYRERKRCAPRTLKIRRNRKKTLNRIGCWGDATPLIGCIQIQAKGKLPCWKWKQEIIQRHYMYNIIRQWSLDLCLWSVESLNNSATLISDNLVL